MILGKILICDARGCGQSVRLTGHEPTARGLAANLRKLAAERGWTRNLDGGDQCPQHVVPEAIANHTGGPAHEADHRIDR